MKEKDVNRLSTNGAYVLGHIDGLKAAYNIVKSHKISETCDPRYVISDIRNAISDAICDKLSDATDKLLNESLE